MEQLIPRLLATWSSDQANGTRIITVLDAFLNFLQRELPIVVKGDRWDKGVFDICATTLIGWDNEFSPNHKVEVEFTEKRIGWDHSENPEGHPGGPCGTPPAERWNLKVSLAGENSEFIRKILELLITAGCPSVDITTGLLGKYCPIEEGITPQRALELLAQPAAAA